MQDIKEMVKILGPEFAFRLGTDIIDKLDMARMFNFYMVTKDAEPTFFNSSLGCYFMGRFNALGLLLSPEEKEFYTKEYNAGGLGLPDADTPVQ